MQTISCGSLIDLSSSSKGTIFGKIFSFSSLTKFKAFLMSKLLMQFSLSANVALISLSSSWILVFTFLIKKQQMQTVSLELLRSRYSCTIATPFLTAARFSMTGLMSLQSGAETGSTFLKMGGRMLSWQFLAMQGLGVRREGSSPAVMLFNRVNCFFMKGLFPRSPSSGDGGAGVRSYSKSSSQEMRLKWSLTNIFLSSSSVFFETLMPVGKLMELLELMRSMRRAILRSSKGQYPKSISQRTTPSDQMSALMVYSSPFRIYGAMQMGEPNIVWERSRASFSGLQNPKSASLRTPLWRRMLLGLISRCMMLLRMSILKALRRSLKQPSALSSIRYLVCLMRFSRVPPLQNSQTKQTLLTVLSIQINLTMWVVSYILESVWISLMVNSSRRGLSLYFQILITLMATICSVFQLMALQTLPNSPSPITVSKQQFQIFFPIFDLLAVIFQLFNSSTNCYYNYHICIYGSSIFYLMECMCQQYGMERRKLVIGVSLQSP